MTNSKSYYLKQPPIFCDMKLTLFAALMNIKIWCAALLLQINPISDFVGQYLFSDFQYLKWLVISMVLDLLTGIAKVVKKEGWKAVTSKGLRDTVVKCVQYGAFVVITHVLTHFQIGGEQQMGNMEWLTKLAFEFIILIEIKSVYENIVAVNSKFDFVAQLVKKLIDLLPKKYKGDENN